MSAYQDAPAELLRGASRAAFAELVSKAIEENVNFMVIAGDLYDGDCLSMTSRSQPRY